MNWDPEGFAEALVLTIKRTVQGPLIGGRFAALEQQLAELQARPALSFAGVFMDTATYTRGDAVTRQGGLWICTGGPTTGPFDHAAWQLAVKKGAAQ